MKDQIIIRAENPDIIEVNGKKYRAKKDKGKILDGILHADKITYVPFDETEHKAKVDYIIGRLKDYTTVEEVFKETLKFLTTDELNKIEKLLKKGAKIKKQRGCLGFKIGDKNHAHLQILR